MDKTIVFSEILTMKNLTMLTVAVWLSIVVLSSAQAANKRGEARPKVAEKAKQNCKYVCSDGGAPVATSTGKRCPDGGSAQRVCR